MGYPADQIITVLNYLLPGFIAAWVFYSLTAYPKPSQFERIVQAFIFTIFIRFFVVCINWLSILFGKYIFTIGEWNNDVSLGFSVILAIILGLSFARYANNDKIHALLRYMKYTQETSFPSEWYGGFSKNKTYVVLHLKDGRRIYGWPEEWPSQPNTGHFSLAEAEWLEEDDGEKNIIIPLEGVDSILIPAEEVKFVEFMKIIPKNEIHTKGGKNG